MGALMIINFDDLINDFAKDQDLHQWTILIASHEIAGSLKTRSMFSGITSDVKYESKYDNIEFVDSLKPPANILESAYNDEKATFVEMYTNHLLNSEPFMDLCCIMDMVVNSDEKVMIVLGAYECAAHVDIILGQFIIDQFGIIVYLYRDLMKLSKNINDNLTYNDKSDLLPSDVLIPFDVPEEFTGRNFDILVTKYTDDIEDVKKTLESQKILAVNMSSDPGEESDITSVFFNRFTEDLQQKLRELLLKKSDDEIKNMCRAKNIRISPKSTKGMLVDKIIHEMKLDVANTVEYELD